YMSSKYGPKPTPIADRLKSKIEIDQNGCWVWQESKDAAGYGRIRVGSRTDGTYGIRLTHRVSYETFVSQIPSDLGLDYLCSVPSCINPSHLEAVTQTESMERFKQRAKEGTFEWKPGSNKRRQYGSGSVFQRKDGLWIGRFEAGVD